MSLSISTNVLSMGAQRALKTHSTSQEKLIGQLSAGLRITTARDDAAGVAIASRMTANHRGATQAIRNLSDGSSMLQVAEGAMANVADNLQRLRELAVASGNAAYYASDRAALQKEAVEILGHINAVGEQTKFNGTQLFAQERTSIGGDEKKRTVLDGLKTGWLSSAEKMVKEYFGLEADGAKITVNLDTSDGAYNVLASVSGSGSGKLGDLHLNIDMADFGTAATRDGGSAPMYSDRIIAHEMVHAIMARSMNFTDLPKWFVEGTAELIHGADERVASAIAGGTLPSAIVAGAAASPPSYEGAYVASRYLHDQLKQAGVQGGIKGVMQYLTRNQSATLDQALNATTDGKIASTSAFMSKFAAEGAAYIGSMNLSNADTGAIGGLDADGGPVADARRVVANAGDNNAEDGLGKFEVIYPEIGGSTGVRRVQVQAGSQASDLIELQFSSMNASALGLADFDLQNAAVSLLHVDQALEFVNQQRVNVGASSNRIEVAISSLQTDTTNLAAAKERIEGVDFASSTAGLTRSQILQQAASAMLAQANSQPRAVLSLLR